MRVFKCDRCGKYFDDISKNRDGNRTGVFLSKCTYMSGEWFDVCNKCFASLERWWGKKMEGKNEDSD